MFVLTCRSLRNAAAQLRPAPSSQQQQHSGHLAWLATVPAGLLSLCSAGAAPSKEPSALRELFTPRSRPYQLINPVKGPLRWMGMVLINMK